MVGSNEQRLPGLTDLHHLDSFVLCDLENVKQLGEGFPIAIVLDDLVNTADISSNIVDCVFLAQ